LTRKEVVMSKTLLVLLVLLPGPAAVARPDLVK
jgi:hypothetical protein